MGTPSYYCAHVTSGKAKGGAKTKNHVPYHVQCHVPCQTSLRQLRAQQCGSWVLMAHLCAALCQDPPWLPQSIRPFSCVHWPPANSSVVQQLQVPVRWLLRASSSPLLSSSLPTPFEDIEFLCLFWFITSYFHPHSCLVSLGHLSAPFNSLNRN